MKLLYKAHYFERLLFVIEVSNSIIMCYKSSGLSGTGHKDQLLPFMYLNDPTKPQSLRDTPGYIYKEMFYNNKFRDHNKELYRYLNLEDNMSYISDFLETFKYAEYNPEEDCPEETVQGYYDFIHKINEELYAICDGREFFDLQNLIKVNNDLP